MSFKTSSIASLVLLGTLFLTIEANGQSLRTVAFQGQAAPGGLGFNFSLLFSPSINDHGDIAFYEGGSEGRSVWVEKNGGLNLVVKEHDPVPGVSNTFQFVGPPVLNNSGDVIFLAGIDTYSHYTGIWKSSNGVISTIMKRGDSAPGTGVQFGPEMPSTIREIVGYSPTLNESGETGFFGELNGSGVDFANNATFYLRSGNTLTLLARDDNRAPDTPSPTKFWTLTTSEVVSLNDNHQVAFHGSMVKSGISQGEGIFSGTANNLKVVARTNDVVPGFPTGTKFNTVQRPSLNANGEILFSSVIEGGGMTGTASAIWVKRASGLSLVVKKGDQAPGMSVGTTLNSMVSSNPLLNSSGDILFRGNVLGTGVTDTTDSAIWAGTLTNPALLAREGDNAPGTPLGVNFDNFYVSSFNNSHSINSEGQISFMTRVIGTGVTSRNNVGIWATDLSGTLHLIARTGEVIEVTPGVFKTIETLKYATLTNNEEGARSGFNDLGQLVFEAQFTDDTKGVFVSNVVAVPEPSTLILAGFALCAIFWAGRCIRG